jgi:hypothetical protein
MTLSIVNEKLLFILSVPFIQPEKITPLNERKSHSRGIKKDVMPSRQIQNRIADCDLAEMV